ncbi:RapZ C-terminal domain-containing protein [Streptomyces lydicus]|uniref:RapZ C-terminal domain-containing protein n=1 Tax=Streptomyces lydicus TaxID=47763 RepID=UPI0037FC2D97
MTYDSSHIQVHIQTIGTLHPGALDEVGDGLYWNLGNKLRNPHHDPAMRYKTGLDDDVRDHVLSTTGAMALTTRIAESAKALLFSYANPRQKLVRVTIACRGGRHRSVAIAEQVAEYLRIDEVGVEVEHCHIGLPVVENQPIVDGEPAGH